MWRRFSESILRFRITLLLIIAVAVSFMAYKGKDVELAFAGAKVLPVTDSAYVAYNEFKKQFGEDGTMMVIGVQSDKIFKKDFYNEWASLGDSIDGIEGISNVLSIGNLFELQKDTITKTFKLKKIHSGDVVSQEECDSIKEKILALPFYANLVLNNDSNTTLMAISYDKNTLNTRRRTPVTNDILRIAKNFEVKNNITLHYSGLPFIRTIISSKVSHEFELFLTLAVIITAVILLIFFRSFYAVLFPIIVVLIGVITSLGTLVLFDYQITLLTGLIPPLIVVIGIPNCILILNKYHTEYMLSQDKVKAMNVAILRVGETTFFANVTTAIGFGVFGLTSSEILTQFGIVASINVMLTWIISLILIPIIFTYLPNPKSWQTKHLENKGLNTFIKKIDFWVHNYSKYVYGITILIVIISLYGMTKINVNGYMVDDLPKRDPVYTDLKFFERNFDGVLPLEVQIDSKRKNGLLNIASIKKIEKLDKMMSSYPEFSRSISLNEVLKFSKQAFYNGDPSFYELPSEGEAAFVLQYAKNSGGNGSMLNSYIDSLNQKTRVSFQVKDVGSNRMNKLLDEVKLRVDSIFNPKKYEVLLTGASVISVKGSNYLLVNLIESLLIAIGLISILMLVLFRTFKMVMISLLPNIVPLLITAGIMGFLGMSLKPSTILIFSIAFGIASDQTLYFLTKFRHEQYTKDWSISKIVSVTLKEAGLGMIYTAIILFFGFGIFSASNFGGTVALGILLSITLLVALISNLILLPTLLLSLERKLEKKKNK